MTNKFNSKLSSLVEPSDTINHCCDCEDWKECEDCVTGKCKEHNCTTNKNGCCNKIKLKENT
jgi:hypothetical protein